MKDKQKVIDMNTKNKPEEHKCEMCGAEALYYNSDAKMWLCENCKKEADEFEKLALKMEKKLSKRVYSFDINELIACLAKDEIYNIARNLGVTKISGLNKDKLEEKLLNEYEGLVTERLDLFDEERYAILKTYEKNGVKTFDEIDEEEAEKSAYFIQQGLLFPAVKDEKSLFIMPEIVQNIVKKKNNIDYRRKLKNNTEIINIYRGINNAYGVLKIDEALEMLERYCTTDDNTINMLKESAYYYGEYIEESGYIINSEINDYKSLLEKIEECNVTEYSIISKEELLSMSKEGWVFDSKAGKSFYKEFTSIFSVDRDMTAAMMEDLLLEVQDLGTKEAVEKMLEILEIDNAEAKFVCANIMNKYANKLRLWKYKGACTNDMKAHVISAKSKKVVGRNDPCICGSGKKYKNCCGRNGNVVKFTAK